jgi:hypothetical protein
MTTLCLVSIGTLYYRPMNSTLTMLYVMFAIRWTIKVTYCLEILRAIQLNEQISAKKWGTLKSGGQI